MMRDSSDSKTAALHINDGAAIDDGGMNADNAGIFFAAAKKLRISQGISRDTLERLAGLRKHSLADLEAGRIKVPKPEKAKTIAEVLGFASVSDMIRQSARTPEITETSVANAIVRIASHRGIEIKELEESAQIKIRSLRQFIIHAGKPKSDRPRMPIALETTFFVAKQLGFSSLADMIAEAAVLPEPEIVDQHRLEKAVEILHLENGGLVKTLPLFKGHKHHRYSAAALKDLPARFGVDSLQALIEKAENLEPAPDRKNFGAAVRKLQHHHKMTNADIMREAGLSIHDVTNIKAPGKNDSPPEKLRRIPKIFGCNSMKEMMDLAMAMPEISAPLNTVRVRGARIDYASACHQQIQESPAEGHWQHLLQQQGIATAVLTGGSSPGQDRA